MHRNESKTQTASVPLMVVVTATVLAIASAWQPTMLPAAPSTASGSRQCLAARTLTAPSMGLPLPPRVARPVQMIRKTHLGTSSLAATAVPSEDSSSEAAAKTEEEKDADSSSSVAASSSLLRRLRAYFTPPKDGLTFKQRLAKMGLAAALSYGWVSNMSYSVTVSLAWYIFSKQTGKSPLAPGQWKGFLAVYAGFWVFNNVVRPLRLAAAVAIGPQFDKFVQAVQDRFHLSKAAAVAVTVVLANLVGTTLFMSAGIAVAAALAGVPVFP